MTDTLIPRTLRFELAAHAPGRGVHAHRVIAKGQVVTESGAPIEVELGLSDDLPDSSEPPHLVVMFKTVAVPSIGLGFHINIIDLLEGVVRAYFRERPKDLAIGEPPRLTLEP